LSRHGGTKTKNPRSELATVFLKPLQARALIEKSKTVLQVLMDAFRVTVALVAFFIIRLEPGRMMKKARFV
jgi:hypothetical protein